MMERETNKLIKRAEFAIKYHGKFVLKYSNNNLSLIYRALVAALREYKSRPNHPALRSILVSVLKQLEHTLRAYKCSEL